MHHPSLFTPLKLGRHTLRNRIVLPPLTRQRAAQPGDVPTDHAAVYYRQRASAGFMVSEGTQIEARGQVTVRPVMRDRRPAQVGKATPRRYRFAANPLR